MSFNKGDIITNVCGCIGVFDHDSCGVYANPYLKKCGSERYNHKILKTSTFFNRPRLSTEEEKSEFKKALIKEGLYYSESNKTVIVNNEF